MAFGRQTGQGTPNTTGAQLLPVKITGDSLVPTLNPLIAEGEIGQGRDVTSAIPGGFQSAGAVNGNLRARAASVLLEAALGTKVISGGWDKFNMASVLPWFTVEKKVGSATPIQLVIQYSDAQVNTLSISAPTAALATFSAGLITAFERRTDGSNADAGGGDHSLATESYPTASDDLLAFHGGRIFFGDSPAQGSTVPIRDDTFQSVEVALNNNIDATEYTVRPSRFLRSLTANIRTLEVNFTMVFENPDKYAKFAYGSQPSTIPGYALYLGAMQVFLGNFQLLNPLLDGVGSALPYASAANKYQFQPATPGVNVYDPSVGAGGSTPAAPGSGTQFVQLNIPKLAFTGFPVALTSGRIVVTTTARALRDVNATELMTAWVGPSGSGLTY